jgi:uncharacterized membrane protein YfcA
LIGSIPLSFIGGSLPLEKQFFEIILFLVLLIAGCLLLFNFNSYDNKESRYRNISLSLSITIGGILGFISGIVGIGGGIFLSPILFLLKVAKPKHIITAASLFILINSIFGIIGQLTKEIYFEDMFSYFYLLIAVLIGGQVGNYLNLKIFPTKILTLITSALVLFVAMRMGINLFK